MRRYKFIALAALIIALSIAGIASSTLGAESTEPAASARFEASAAVLAPEPPPSPSRVERRTVFSPSLGRDMSVIVYLPQGYDSAPHRRFPVIYMLHGLNGDQDAWRSCGLFKAADDATANGQMPPTIIVTPNGENGYWVDQANRGPRYGSYIAKDLVSFMDSTYQTLPQQESRAIGGMSMGGHGALQLAMNFPDTFSVVGAHSVALRTYDQAFSFFGDRSYFAKHDPVQLFRDNAARGRSLHIWIDVGQSDPWYNAAAAFNSQLSGAQIDHEWHVYPGGHDATYWSAHVGDYLAFYGRWLAYAPMPPVLAVAH